MASFPVETNKPTSSFGSARRFDIPKSKRETPGPGEYVGSALTSSQYASCASLPWSTISRSQKAEKTAGYVGAQSVFGAQVSSTLRSASASSFGLARRLPVLKTPGPLDYSPHNTSAFSRSAEKRDRSFGSDDRFNLSTPSPEQKTPGQIGIDSYQAGYAALGPGRVLSDWRNSPNFSFSTGARTDKKLIFNSQANTWRSQGPVGQTSPGPLSHDPPQIGNELGKGPAASLKGPFPAPKRRAEPHAQTYTPLSLYWDGRQALGKSASSRSLSPSPASRRPPAAV